MIAYNDGVIDTEYHSSSESAIKAGKILVKQANEFPNNIIGIRIEFSNNTSAVYNRIQQSECLIEN